MFRTLLLVGLLCSTAAQAQVFDMAPSSGGGNPGQHHHGGGHFGGGHFGGGHNGDDNGRTINVSNKTITVNETNIRTGKIVIDGNNDTVIEEITVNE